MKMLYQSLKRFLAGLALVLWGWGPSLMALAMSRSAPQTFSLYCTLSDGTFYQASEVLNKSIALPLKSKSYCVATETIFGMFGLHLKKPNLFNRNCFTVLEVTEDQFQSYQRACEAVHPGSKPQFSACYSCRWGLFVQHIQEITMFYPGFLDVFTSDLVTDRTETVARCFLEVALQVDTDMFLGNLKCKHKKGVD